MYRLSRIAVVCLVLASALMWPANAYGFDSAPLPSDNLVVNPWFRDANNPNEAGFSSWVNVNDQWVLSQKTSNPTPDLLLSGRCSKSRQPTACGTAAKLSADDGNGQVGVDSYLYQVVAANAANTKLKFFTHWVAHTVDPFEVNIYGGPSSNDRGPWTLVWTPVRQQALIRVKPPRGESQSWLWQDSTSKTPMVETVIPAGFPYYKVEIHVKLPTPDGFKVSGVYFAAVANGGGSSALGVGKAAPVTAATAVPSVAPRAASTDGPGDIRRRIETPTVAPPEVAAPNPAIAEGIGTDTGGGIPSLLQRFLGWIGGLITHG